MVWVAVGLVVGVAVAVAVGVRLGVPSKFPGIGALELRAGVILVAVSSGRTKKMMRIQRLAHLFLRGGGSIFSVIGVIGGSSGGFRNLLITSLSSFLGYTANGK